MTEIKAVNQELMTENKIRAYLGRLWFHPKHTMQAIAQHESKIWLIPLLILMATSLILNLSTTAVNQQNFVQTMPPDIGYYSEDYQQEYIEVMDNNNGFASTTLFPTLLKWMGIWGGWLILATLLMVILLLQNHPLEWHNVFNLSAWSALPFAIRDIIQAIFLLTSKQLITSPGLSGFASPNAEGFSLYCSIILTFIDVYLFWQIFLIFHAIHKPTRLSMIKTLITILITFLISITLRAFPGFLIAKISAIFSNGMGFFF